jgi:putative inorganic carbon (HCO3(-)) transporter
MNLLLARHHMERTGVIVLVLTMSAGAGLLLSSDPGILLLMAGGACATAIALFLLQRPLLALYVALFPYLIPFGLIPFGRLPTEFDYAYTIASNGAIGLAVCAWMLHAPLQRRPIRCNSVCLLIALYIVWACVTLLWAPDLIEGRKRLVGYGIGLTLLFLIVQQVRTVEAVDGLMRILAIVGWLLVTAGLWTLLLAGYHSGARLKIFEINENAVGYFLTLGISGTIWPVLRSSGLRRRLYMVLSILFILCALILVLASGSRGSALSMVIMLLAFWFWKPLRPWGIVGGVLVACMLTAAPFLLDALTNRSTEGGGNQLGGRNILWEASLQLIADHPLTGAGVGNGRFELHHYIAPLTSDYDHRNDLPSHNPLLEVGVDTGLFGMFLYTSIWVSGLWQFIYHCGSWYMRKGALAAYFPLELGVAAGYFLSYIKDGGMENHPTFFALLALLIIPSQLSHDPTRKNCLPPGAYTCTRVKNRLPQCDHFS